MAEYTEAFAGFILECREAFNDLCQEILTGRVPANQQATVRITLPAGVVDQIRRDLLVEANGNG